MSTPAARTTFSASAVTSGPMPSPAMTAILCDTWRAPECWRKTVLRTRKPPTEVDGRVRTPRGGRVLRGYEVMGGGMAAHDEEQSRAPGSVVAMSETTATQLSPEAHERLRAELEDLTTRG